MPKQPDPQGVINRLKRHFGFEPARSMTEQEIEAEVLKQLAHKSDGARAAEAITAEDLNAVVGGRHCKFGSRVRF